MSEARLIAKAMSEGKPVQDMVILPALANRHGLITGATGTVKPSRCKYGRTVFRIGIPVFLADVKGDLSGIGAAGVPSEKLSARLNNIGVTDWQPQACSIIPWIFRRERPSDPCDDFDLGPLLLRAIAQSNDVQAVCYSWYLKC